jgi:hypothetical protein
MAGRAVGRSITASVIRFMTPQTGSLEQIRRRSKALRRICANLGAVATRPPSVPWAPALAV